MQGFSLNHNEVGIGLQGAQCRSPDEDLGLRDDADQGQEPDPRGDIFDEECAVAAPKRRCPSRRRAGETPQCCCVASPLTAMQQVLFLDVPDLSPLADGLASDRPRHSRGTWPTNLDTRSNTNKAKDHWPLLNQCRLFGFAKK